MSTSDVKITEGSGKNVATYSITEDAETKELQRIAVSKSDGTDLSDVAQGGGKTISDIVTAIGTPMQASGGSVTANAGTNLNTSALATTTNVAALPQAASGTDGSSTITTGGTAQDLFSSATPTNGFAIYNPDATEDLWISLSTTAVANGTGCIRIAANGGGYETPIGLRPFHAISVVGATAGHKFTAIRW